MPTTALGSGRVTAVTIETHTSRLVRIWKAEPHAESSADAAAHATSASASPRCAPPPPTPPLPPPSSAPPLPSA